MKAEDKTAEDAAKYPYFRETLGRIKEMFCFTIGDLYKAISDACYANGLVDCSERTIRTRDWQRNMSDEQAKAAAEGLVYLMYPRLKKHFDMELGRSDSNVQPVVYLLDRAKEIDELLSAFKNGGYKLSEDVPEPDHALEALSCLILEVANLSKHRDYRLGNDYIAKSRKLQEGDEMVRRDLIEAAFCVLSGTACRNRVYAGKIGGILKDLALLASNEGAQEATRIISRSKLRTKLSEEQFEYQIRSAADARRRFEDDVSES